jgi:hypothetical protein
MLALVRTTVPFRSPAAFNGASFDAVPPQVGGASVRAASPRWSRRQSSDRRRRASDRRFRPQSRDSLPRAHAGASPPIDNVNARHGRLEGRLSRRPLKRLSHCSTARGVATKNLPNDLGWRRALEAWGDQIFGSYSVSVLVTSRLLAASLFLKLSWPGRTRLVPAIHAAPELFAGLLQFM